MGETSTKIKQHNLSIYDKVSTDSRTRKLLPKFLCYVWLARILDIGHLVRVFKAKLVCD